MAKLRRRFVFNPPLILRKSHQQTVLLAPTFVLQRVHPHKDIFRSIGTESASHTKTLNNVPLTLFLFCNNFAFLHPPTFTSHLIDVLLGCQNHRQMTRVRREMNFTSHPSCVPFRGGRLWPSQQMLRCEAFTHEATPSTARGLKALAADRQPQRHPRMNIRQ